MLTLVIFTLTLVVCRISTEQIHYVKPVNSSTLSCPGQPCLSLDQYIQQTATYFTTGSTFLFLPGNHISTTAINLANISNITLKQRESDYPIKVNITYSNEVCIVCQNVTDLKIEGLRFKLYSSNTNKSSAIKLYASNGVTLSNSTFIGSGDLSKNLARAIYLVHSSITVENCIFERNTADNGGAMHMSGGSHVTLIGSAFISNKAHDSGGAISSEDRILGKGNNRIAMFNKTLLLSGRTVFHNNEARFGGAVKLVFCNATFSGRIEFTNNSAEEGGGIHCVYSQLIINTTQLDFIGNTAQSRGGGIFISYVNETLLLTGKTNFSNNRAKECGGAGFFESLVELAFHEVSILENSESALCIINGIVNFLELASFCNNYGRYGGAIHLVNSKVLFHENTSFTQNRADRDGGAIYASGAKVTIKSETHFKLNSAQNGGGIYFKNLAVLNLFPYAKIFTHSNHASKYGGVFYHEDTATAVQCNYETNTGNIFPSCFIVLKKNNLFHREILIGHSDSADLGGSILYGGLLDRCQINLSYLTGIISSYNNTFKLMLKLLNVEIKDVKSKPYELCFCNNSSLNCNSVTKAEIYRGQKLAISLLAIGQGGVTISTDVTAIVSPTARLKLNQSSQHLPQHCTDLNYNLYSTKDHEELVLHPDGPCHDTGLARAVIEVTLLPCPKPFIIRGEQCVCDKRLEEYIPNCVLDEEVSIRRSAGSRFWLNASFHVNSSYHGLILFSDCPLGYCETQTVQVPLDDPDIQCAQNRSGVLCGACGANYSLMLGSSRCKECSNSYIALLLLFATAGIALVVFLFILRLTVVTGMINSVILYANIVQVNKHVLLPHSRNIFTFFIAWMNLDLGFETCFYNGMTAYTQTWLQLVFPAYVWIIIGLIIIISRYSVRVSKLIGHNPIAVLATLLLMSYTKILKIVIEVYSSAQLEYPDNKTVTVWLKDGNVPYLESWHLLLTVVTSLVLVFLFLPYTLLLLLGYKFYRFSGRKHMHWLNRLKPLLDSYYAPYNKHTRCWTGFLLLVRCALYIVFSYNSLGATSKSLLAIIITFTAIIVIAWLSVKIYKRTLNNIVEASIYLNLIVLSAVTLAELESPALVHSLVGTVFITMMAIIAYHFHTLYISKSTIWKKIETKASRVLENIRWSRDTKNTPPVLPPPMSSSHDPHEIVSKTVIELREPLLESSFSQCT